VTAPDDVIARIAAADAADAAMIVLALPWPQARAVIAAAGPRQVARLLLGVRADRVQELIDHIAPPLLPAVLAHVPLAEIAQLLPLLSMEGAMRAVHSLPPDVAAEVLLVLPSAQRRALQAVVAQAAAAGPSGGYGAQVERAVRRTVERVTLLDPRAMSMVTEVFGRPVQVVVWDRPGKQFGQADLRAAIGTADWRQVAALLVVTNATLDPALPGAVREARAAGYAVEPVQWLDDRDDGTLKRILVRLVS
jgi:hypothetical protein